MEMYGKIQEIFNKSSMEMLFLFKIIVLFEVSGPFKTYSGSIPKEKVIKRSYLRAQNGSKWSKFMFFAISGRFGL